MTSQALGNSNDRLEDQAKKRVPREQVGPYVQPPKRLVTKASRRDIFDNTPRQSSSRRGHIPQESQELHISRHVTRDSMVENMLMSLNQMPDESQRRVYGYQTEPLISRTNVDAHEERSSPLAQTSPRSHEPEKHTDRLASTPNPEEQRQDAQTTRRPSRAAATPRASTETFNFHSRPPSPSSAKKSSTPKGSTKLTKRTKRIDGGSAGSSVDRGSSKGANIRRHRAHSSVTLGPGQTTPPPRPELPHRETGSSILDRARPIPLEYHVFESSPEPQSQDGSKVLPRNLQDANYQRDNIMPQQSTRNKLAALTGEDMTAVYKNQNMANNPNSLRSVSLGAVNPSNPPIDRSLSSHEPHIQASTATVREQRGFFKRVFGSSSRSNLNSQENSTLQKAPQLPPLQVAGGKVDDSKNSLLSDDRSVSTSSIPKPPPEPVTQDPPQILHKKSSFFRRRKKTLTEKETASNPEAATRIKSGMNTNLPSPSVSSLRKVMNPFLNETADSGLASPADYFFDSKEAQSNHGEEEEAVYIFAKDSSDNVTRNNSLSMTRGVQTKGHESPISPTSRPAQGPRRDDSLSLKIPKSRPAGTSTSLPPEDRSPSEQNVRQEAEPQHETPINDLPLRQASSADATPQHPAPQKSPTVRRNIPSPLAIPSQPQSQHDDDGWVIPTPTRAEAMNGLPSAKSNRIWLHPTASEEDRLAQKSLDVGRNAASRQASGASVISDEPLSAASIPIVQVDGEGGIRPPTAPEEASNLSKTGSVSEDTPTVEDFEVARELFHGYDHISVAKTASLLGQAGHVGERLRRAYMSFYDFTGLNILMGFRELCEKFALKGESQQVDRILASFSCRWCDCNPNHGFKTVDVVHTMCYSILLLNTDLHVAELDQKMTRSQFLRNTMPLIKSHAEESGVDNDTTIRANSVSTRGGIPWREAHSPSPAIVEDGRHSVDARSGSDSRLSLRPRPISEVPSFASPTPYDVRPDPSDALTNAPFEGSIKGWEAQVENVLKDIYRSIERQRLPLHGASELQLHEQPSNNSLSVAGALRRTGSLMSKNGGENMRGRSNPDFRQGGSRWNNKKPKQKMYANSVMDSSRATSRTSLEESLWTPSTSSTWSKSHFNKTLTSISSDSLGSHMTQSNYGYQQSIGFANALSHAIIREEGSGSAEELPGDNPQIDEALELAGAPWAKEGILQHKHHLENPDKKAKDRHWNECFVVIEKGWMRLFSFNSKASVKSQKNKAFQGSGVVGGGNWTESMEALGSFMLRQTIANALPAPGYSKQRPHVFALSLPTGAVHLFQVGTPDIAREFVSTANYWSARLSKEPLVGGVSNVEYGWGDCVINGALVNKPNENSRPDSNASRRRTGTGSDSGFSANPLSPRRPSFQGSIRSSIDHQGVMRARLPADRINLSDWSPPQQSLMASSLPEGEQLASLRKYVHDVEDDLAKHNELRAPMLLAYTSRTQNATKALHNWEKKSSYLLQEIVKFQTYVDSLKAATAERESVMAAKLADDKSTPSNAENSEMSRYSGVPELPEAALRALRLTSRWEAQ